MSTNVMNRRTKQQQKLDIQQDDASFKLPGNKEMTVANVNSMGIEAPSDVLPSRPITSGDNKRPEG